MKLPEVEMLAMYLSDRAKEDAAVVTFEEISEQVGVDIRKKRHLLTSAMKTLIKEYNIVLKNIRNIGYQILRQGAIAETISRKRQSRIESQTNLWDSEMKTVNISNLTQQELKEHTRFEGRLTIQKLLIDEKNQKRIDDVSARRAAQRITDAEFARKAVMMLKDVS